MATLSLQPISAQTRVTGETEEAYQDRMQWFGDAKFGVFIHWGIYSVRGVSESWSFFNNYLPYEEYMQQLDGFTAEKYNAKEWVDLIEQREYGTPRGGGWGPARVGQPRKTCLRCL